MTTVQTQVTDRQGLDAFFYLRISGLPYYFFATIDPSNSRYGSFSWPDPTTYPTGWNRGGLMLPDDTIEQKFPDIIGGIASAGRVRLKVIDFPDPAATGYGFFSRLFAPGRALSDATIQKAPLTASVHADGSTTDLNVQNKGATFVDGDDIYLGNETIGIDTVTGPDGNGVSVLNIDQRNLYVCYGNTADNPDAAFPPIPYHRVQFDSVGNRIDGPIVSSSVTNVLGRHAALWMGHMRPDGNPEPESSSACLLLGRITSLDIDSTGGAFDLEIESVIADLKTAQVAPDLAAATIRPGIYLPDGHQWRSFTVAVNLGDGSQLITASVAVASGVYSPADLSDEINDAIQAIDTGNSTANGFIHALTLVIVDAQNGPTYGFTGGPFQVDATTGVDVFVIRPTFAEDEPRPTSLLTVLGFSPDLTALDTNASNPEPASDTFGVLHFAARPVPEVFIPTTSFVRPLDVVLNEPNAADGFVTDQGDGSSKAYVRLGDGHVVELISIDSGGNLLGMGFTLISPANRAAVDMPGFYYVDSGGTGTVEQNLVLFQGQSSSTSALFLAQSIASTTGQTQDDLNVFPEGAGLGWRALIDGDEWRLGYDAGVPRELFLDRSTKFADIFTPISREHGLFIVWDPSAGMVSLRRIQIPQLANADGFRFDESNRSDPGDRTVQRLNTASLRTSWKIQAGWDWASNKFTMGPVVINDMRSRSNYPNNARQETIEDKTLLAPTGLGDSIVHRMELYGQAWTNCQRSANKRAMLLSPGSIHRIVDATMVNPYTGATGITSADSVFGFLTSVSSNPATGDVRVEFAVSSSDDNQLYRPWSPVGLVSIVATDNGYNSATKTLTMLAYYTGQAGKGDGADFAAGDKVRINARDTTSDDPISYDFTDTVASVSSDGLSVVLTTGLGSALDAFQQTVVMLDEYAGQATTRKTGATKVAWQGNGDTGIINSVTSAHLNKWG